MQKRFNKKLVNNVFIKEIILSLVVIYKIKVVGDLFVWYINMKDIVEIGYSFLNEVVRRGLVIEVVSSLVLKLFNECNVYCIQVNFDVCNIVL